MTALASSLRERPVPEDTLILGEVGLTGMVRDVTDRAARLKEAARYGFKRVVLATSGKAAKSQAGMKIDAVTTVGEAMDAALNSGRAKGGAG
jgi:DNA repair protein RadA/Sms